VREKAKDSTRSEEEVVISIAEGNTERAVRQRHRCTLNGKTSGGGASKTYLKIDDNGTTIPRDSRK